MAELLKTPYVDGVYFPTPLAISHPKEEEEEDDTATSFEPPPPTRASRKTRKLLIDEEIEEEKEGLTVPHTPRQGP